MTTYNGFIRFDGFDRRWNDPRVYQKAVLDLTYQISRTTTGKCVLHEIKASGFELTVKPSRTMYEVEANPGGKHGAVPRSDFTIVAKAGKGLLEFLPGHYDAKAGVFVDWDPYFRVADNYVHELVHKARMMQGLFSTETTGDGYHNLEEFFAILVANIHASELGANSRLRGSHAELFEPLKLSSYDFWFKYDLRLNILARQMRDFTKRLATIKCQFNPYRDYYNNISNVRDAPATPGMPRYPGHGA